MIAAARAALPELPADREPRATRRDFGLAADPARLLAYEPQWGDYFEARRDRRVRRARGRELGRAAARPDRRGGRPGGVEGHARRRSRS